MHSVAYYDIQQVGSIAGAVVAVLGVLTGFWWAIRKLVHIADAVNQLLPNGGSSLADKVNDMKRLLDAHIAGAVDQTLSNSLTDELHATRAALDEHIAECQQLQQQQQQP